MNNFYYNFNILGEKLRGESAPSILSDSITWHEMYREGGIIDEFHTSGASLNASNEDRQTYINKRLTNTFSNPVITQEQASNALARNAFTAFNADISNILSTGTNAIKRIISYMDVGSENLGLEGNYDAFIGKSIGNVWDIVQGPNTIEDSNFPHYRGLASTGDAYIDTARGRLIEHKTNIDGLDRARYSVNTRLKGIDPRDEPYIYKNEDYSYIPRAYRLSNKIEGRLATVSGMRKRVNDIRNEMARFRGVNQYSTKVAVDNLMDRVSSYGGYFNKPGIEPIISLIESSNEELSIDLFQLQNQSIGDVLLSRLVDKTDDIITGKFKFNIKLASSDTSTMGSTGHIILGPNIIELERLRIFRDALIDTAYQHYKTNNDLAIAKGTGPLFPNDEAIRERAEYTIMSNFRMVAAGRKNHPKVFINEQFGMLGSLNLTNPVGSSIHQEGSNYESVRLLHLHNDFYGNTEKLIDPDFITGYRRNLYMSLLHAGKSMHEANIESYNRISSSKLFVQLREANKAVMEDPLKSGGYITKSANIGGSYQIFQHLRNTLTYLTNTDTKGKMAMLLDQSFILGFSQEHRDKMYRGEFGEERINNNNLDKRREFEKLQDDLYRLSSQNRLQVLVDVRNYRETILEPTYAQVSKILGDNFINLYDGSLERLAGDGTFQQKERRLKSLGITNIDLIKQIQIITSGSIKLGTVPKQHTKSFFAYGETKHGINPISYYLGSSNLGSESLGLDNYSSSEFGLLLANKHLRRINTYDDPYNLTTAEENLELETASNNFFRQWRSISGGDPSSTSFSRAMWESRVDRKGLDKMVEDIRLLNTDLGFDPNGNKGGIQYSYMYGGATGTDRVGIQLSLSTNALTGGNNNKDTRFNLRFTTLKDHAGTPGYVYAIDQGKVIGNSRWINDSDKEITMPFSKNVSSGEAITLDPIQNTMMMIGSLAGEMINRTLVWGPQQYLSTVFQQEGMSGAIINYFESIMTGRGQGGNWLLSASITDIRQLQHTLINRFMIGEGNTALDKVRQLTGIDDSKNRIRDEHLQQTIARLEELIDSKDRIRTLAGITQDWMGTDPGFWSDLALDIVTSTHDAGYYDYIHKGLKSFRTTLFEDKITRGQASVYGGPQAWFKMSAYGIDESNYYNQARELMAQGDTASAGIGRIYRYMRFIPKTYGPTHDKYTPGAIINIAEGGGSRPGSDVESGLTTFGLYKQTLGDITDINLIKFTGVGTITYRKDYIKYLGSLMNKGTDITELEQDPLINEIMYGKDGIWGSSEKKTDLIATYIFDDKKMSQISQRLKNVIGSKPLAVISRRAQSILESDDIDRGLRLNNEMDKHITILRNQVKQAIINTGAIVTEKELEDRANRIIDDEHRLGFMFGGGIRSVLSTEASSIIQDIRAKVIEELGLNEDDVDFNENLIAEITRTRLVAMDLLSGGMKGFIGPREGKSSIALVQLGGAYSDHFYANPVYGGPNGLREGFLERTQKRLKGSMLKADWVDTYAGNEIIARRGDIVTFDKERQKVIVIDGTTSATKMVVDAGAIPDYHLEAGMEIVSNTDLRTVFRDIADNKKGLTNQSSYAKGEISTWYREGEDSIEYTLSANKLVANPETNEMLYEFMLVRSLKPGGGRRIESHTGLVKGVAIFAQETLFRSVLEQVQEQRDRTRKNDPNAMIPAMADESISVHDIFGLFNPSNLKSYFYTHGSNIVRNKGMINNLMGMNDAAMASAILLSYGTDFIKPREGESTAITRTRKKRIERALFRTARSGDIGLYYKRLASAAIMMENISNSVRDNAIDYLTYELGQTNISEQDIDNVLNDRVLVERFTEEALGRSLMSKSVYSGIQTPALLSIEASDVIDALEGNTNNRNLRNRVDRILNVAKFKDYVEIDDPAQRSAVMVATSLDLMAQIANQPNNINLPMDTNLRDMRVLKQIASIMGIRDISRLDHDKDYREEIISTIKGLVSSTPTIMMYMDLAFSQSKEPIGSKWEGNLEFQHLIKPFHAQAKELSMSGSKNELRRTIATIMAALSEGEFITSIADSGLVDNASFKDITNLEMLTPETRLSYLGAYGSNDPEFLKLKKKYADFVKSNRGKRNKVINNLQQYIKELRSLGPEGSSTYDIGKAHTLYKRINASARALQNLIFAEDDDTVSKLIDMSRKFELDSSKGFGTGQTDAIINAMQDSGQKGIAFSLPRISGREIMSDGSVRVSFDYSSKTYVYLPSAKDLKGLGSNFGSYIGEDLKTAINLSSGFAPGTSMNLIFQKMARNKMMGYEELILSAEELQDIETFWTNANNMNWMLADSISGARASKIFAGENRMPGLVSTPVPSFLVPQSMAHLAEEGLRRHGLYLNPNRMKAHNRSLDIIRSLSKNTEDRKRSSRQIMRNLGTQARSMLQGISPEATNVMVKMRNLSAKMNQLVGDIERANQLNLSEEHVRSTIIELHNMSNELTSLNTRFDTTGDAIASLIGKEEGLYWHSITKSVVAQYNLGHMDNPLDIRNLGSRTKRQLEAIRARSIKSAKARANTSYMVDGFMVGSNSAAANDGLRINIEELSGTIRGRTKVGNTFNSKGIIDKFKGEEYLLRDFTRDKLERMIRDFSALQDHIQHGYFDNNRELKQVLHDLSNKNTPVGDLQILITKLEGVRTKLSSLNDYKDIPKVKQLMGSIETIISTHDTTHLMEVIGFRSPPPGGTELHRQGLGLIRQIGLLNKYSQSISDSTGDTMVSFDEGRNKTASIFSPLSILTMNLGDFDGDPYTAIFSGVMDYQRELNHVEDAIAKKRLKIKHLNKEINQRMIKLEAIANTRAKLKYLKYGPNSDKKNTFFGNKPLSPKYLKLLEEAENAKKEIAIIESQIDVDLNRANKIRLKVNQANEELSNGKFASAMRKEVANYMGINRAFFEAGTEGYLSNAIDINVLPTFIEQGRGLFGGLEDQGYVIQRLQDVMTSIMVENIEDDRLAYQSQANIHEPDPLNNNGERLVKLRASDDAIKTRLQELSLDPNQQANKGLYYMLLSMDEVRQNLLKDMTQGINLGTNEGNTQIAYDQYRKNLEDTSNSLFNASVAMRGIQKYMSKGSGISLELNTYDLLTKVLGKAGGDILGKTYNTIIGTLYADSPLLALGHVLGTDGTNARERNKRAIANKLGIEQTDLLYAEIDRAGLEAEGLQGFLKNIHQLLRDSIKFKNESPEQINLLKSKAEQYANITDEKDRQSLIYDMAANIGPGPGMGALMNLNTLVMRQQDLVDLDINDRDKAANLLSSVFGIGLNASKGNISEFDTLAQEVRILNGGEDVSTYEVVAYKVSSDIKALVTAFRYEKYSGLADRIFTKDALRGRILKRTTYFDDVANKLGFSSARELMAFDGRVSAEDDDLDPKRLKMAKYDDGTIDVKQTFRDSLDLLADIEISTWFSNNKNPSNIRQVKAIIGNRSIEELSREEKALIMTLVQEQEKQTKGWLGQFGERLSRFTTFSRNRLKTASAIDNKGTELLNDVTDEYLEADVTLSMMNLAGSEKLTGNSAVKVFEHLVKHFANGMAPPKPSDYKGGRNSEEYKQAIRDYKNGLMETIIRRTYQGNTYSTIDTNTLSLVLDNLMAVKNLEIIGEDGIRTVYESGLRFISEGLQPTATGQRHIVLQEMIGAEDRIIANRERGRHNTKLSEVGMVPIEPSAPSLSAELGSPVSESGTMDLNTVMEMVSAMEELGVTPDMYMDNPDPRTNNYGNAMTRDFNFIRRNTAKAQRASSVLDIIAPVALTLLGGAMFSGSITPDNINQVTGAAFTTLAYSKQSIAAKGGLAITGGSFRLQSAINEEQGNVGQGILTWAGRELGFGIGAMIMAPAIEGFVDRNMFKALAPEMIDDIDIPRPRSGIGRALKSGSALDVDKFVGAKALSGSVSGALLSAAMGMVMSSAVDSMVSIVPNPGSGSIIDSAIQAVNNMAHRARDYRLESEISNEEVFVEDESGYRLEDDREIVPEQFIRMMAIDPLSNIDYTFSTPGFSQVGVSVTKDEISMEIVT